MRLGTFIGLALLAFSFAGCERNPSTPKVTSPSETFPEPKASSERTAFEQLATKKKEFIDKRRAMEKTNLAEEMAFIGSHGGSKNFDGAAGPSPNKSPEAIAARAELAKIRNAHSAQLNVLNKDILHFLDTEFFPGLLVYAKYCHQTFLAEPNKTNGGELVKLLEELYENGNLDEVFLYSTDLLKNDFDSLQLYDLAAASAYCTDHFNEAAEFFDKAQQKGHFARVLLVTNKEDIVTSQKAWEAEVAIRAKETTADDLPRVKLETEVGDLIFELYENEAPETVANFISLVESGYYDNTTFYSAVLTSHFFHGSKKGDNRDTVGYQIYCETDNPNRRFPFRGTLTMITAEKNQGGSIYTVSIRPSPFNVGYCTTFGRIVEGFDVLPKLAKFNLRFPMPGMEPTKVIKATVVRKRDHEYLPHKVE